MGNIANRMLIEYIYKLKARINEKRAEKTHNKYKETDVKNSNSKKSGVGK